MRKLLTFFSLSIFTSILFFTACASAYSSHHGNRAARYNNVPYNSAYRYNYYNHGGVYMGRPYRRW